MPLPSTRVLNGFGFIITILAMGFAFFLEYIVELAPCNLCMLQRATMVTLGIIFLIAFLHNPGNIGSRIYAVITTLFAGAGIGLAWRHIWLQNLPPEAIPSCGPDFSYMMEEFPITETIIMILEGSGDCAAVSWRLFGLSIPQQLLFLFVAFTIMTLFQVFRPKRM